MWTSAAPHFHTLAWLTWLAAAMLAALSTRNPIYLVLIAALAIIVNTRLERLTTQRPVREQQRAAFRPSGVTINRSRGLLLRAVIGLTIAVALLKGFSLHIGVTVLFRLPEEWPVLGGPITLESLVASSLDGLSLLAVLAVFTAFSAGADYYSILRSLPPFLHQVGLVTSIAITFVPQTVDRFAEIREAQALRGHRIRSLVDLLPLVMPLLAGGMERSMNLAEAMDARGFSRSPAGARPLPPIVTQSGLAAGMALILAGAVLPAFLTFPVWLGWLTVVAGVGLMGVTLWAVGRGSKRERYRRSIWRNRDTTLTALSVGVVAFLLFYRARMASVLIYYPFPRLHPPTFAPLVALALLVIAAPALLAVRSPGFPTRQ